VRSTSEIYKILKMEPYTNFETNERKLAVLEAQLDRLEARHKVLQDRISGLQTDTNSLKIGVSELTGKVGKLGAAIDNCRSHTTSG